MVCTMVVKQGCGARRGAQKVNGYSETLCDGKTRRPMKKRGSPRFRKPTVVLKSSEVSKCEEVEVFFLLKDSALNLHTPFSARRTAVRYIFLYYVLHITLSLDFGEVW